MLKVYETMRSFDGMDEGQRFWYLGWYDNENGLHQMHAVTDDGDDAERLVKTWLIENTDYTADHEFDLDDDGQNIGKLGVMMRTDATVRSMLDEIVDFVGANESRDWFEIDDDWEAGYKRGKRSTKIPNAPKGRDDYHYKCGVVQGMYVKLARMTGASFNFIKTWLIPGKTEPVEIEVAGSAAIAK